MVGEEAEDGDDDKEAQAVGGAQGPAPDPIPPQGELGDQDRQPIKGDTVAFEEEGQATMVDWTRAEITSAQTGTRYYYNAQRLQDNK